MILTLTERDEGKRVVDTNGECLGVIEECERGVAYVAPDGQRPEQPEPALDRQGEVYTVESSVVHSVTEEEIYVNR
jgi:hypothetical protein